MRCLPAQTRIMSRDTSIIRIINAYMYRAARDARKSACVKSTRTNAFSQFQTTSQSLKRFPYIIIDIKERERERERERDSHISK